MAWTLELPRFVTDRLGGHRVLIIGTYRSSELGPELEAARAALANHAAVHLELAGLDEPATAELAAEYGPALSVRDDTAPARADRRQLRCSSGTGPVDGCRGRGTPARAACRSGCVMCWGRRLAWPPRRPPPALGARLRYSVAMWISTRSAISRKATQKICSTRSNWLCWPAFSTSRRPGRARSAHALIRDTIYDDMVHPAPDPAARCGPRSTAPAGEVQRIPPRSPDHAVAAATPDTASAAADFAMALLPRPRPRDTVGAPAESVRQWRATVRMLDLAGVRPAGPQPNALERAVLARRGLVAALARAGDVVSARDEQKRTLALTTGNDALTVGALTLWDAPLVWRLRTTDAADEDIVVPLRRVLASDHPGPCGRDCYRRCSPSWKVRIRPPHCRRIRGTGVGACGPRRGPRRLRPVVVCGAQCPCLRSTGP